MKPSPKRLLILSFFLLGAWLPCQAGEGALLDKAAQWASGVTGGSFSAARAEKLLCEAQPQAPAAKAQPQRSVAALSRVVCLLKGLDKEDCVYRCSDGKERRKPSNSFPGDPRTCPPFIFPF